MIVLGETPGERSQLNFNIPYRDLQSRPFPTSTRVNATVILRYRPSIEYSRQSGRS